MNENTRNSTNNNNNNNNNMLLQCVNGCFFVTKPSLQTHLYLLTSKQKEYLEALQTICDTPGVVSNLSQPTMARILAALQMTGQHKAMDEFLKHCDVVEITKAAQILDRPRLMKQLECRIAAIEQAHPHLKEATIMGTDDTEQRNKSPTKGRRTRGAKWDMATDANKINEKKTRKRRRQVDVYRSELKHQEILMKEMCGPDELPVMDETQKKESTAVREIVASASLSGAFARKVRRFAKDMKAECLEFILMSGSVEYWKILADLVHFRPKDFALPFFLSAVHGGELPDGSFVKGMKRLADVSEEELFEHFQALSKAHPQQLFQAFNFLRTQPRLLRNAQIAEILARNIPLATAIWYLEELAQCSKQVPTVVSERLREESWMDQSSKVTDSFGKLLERILTFRSFGWLVAGDLLPAAEKRLAALKETWATDEEQGLTVIFGDKSFSMESAIRAATIMAAMISTCFSGELCFFDHAFRKSPHAKPCTVKNVLDICRQIRASGGTSLAAALWQYYERKTRIDRIILVSDEEENTECNGYMFARLLRVYMDEVQKDVELVVICVGKGNAEFRSSVKRHGIDCKRIEIDGNRPDLSKFDSMLSQIALLSDTSKAIKRSVEAVPSLPVTIVEATSALSLEDDEHSVDMDDDFVVLDDGSTVEGW
ncbi:hypothetical protein ACA910_003794 [Epithemia clementina (nom. ined.)]